MDISYFEKILKQLDNDIRADKWPNDFTERQKEKYRNILKRKRDQLKRKIDNVRNMYSRIATEEEKIYSWLNSGEFNNTISDQDEGDEMKELIEKGYSISEVDEDAGEPEEDLSEMTDEEYMEIMS